MAKKAASVELDPLTETPAELPRPEPPPEPDPPIIGTVLLETESGVSSAFPDEGFGPTDYRIRVAGTHYDHVGDASDGRWIYRRH